MSRPRLLRWLPALAAPLLVAGVVAAPMVANAAQPLPAKSAAEVLRLISRASSLPGFSGTVAQTSDLGLPILPTTGAASGSGAASTLDLLTGSHRAEVWVSGRTRERVAVLDQAGERDVVRSGRTVWTWDSAKRTASETTVAIPDRDRMDGTGGTTQLTPAEAASMFLAKAGPSTTITVDRDSTVAGRGAYTLVLTPKTTATTIGSVRIAVDAATGLPLQVAVTARGASTPAFQVGFVSLTVGAPAASVFAFTPPSGASVERRTLTGGTRTHRSLPAKPAVVGTDWSSVVEVPAADVPAGLASDATLQRLTQAVQGGRVLSTGLVTVLVADDGRVLAGAVPASTLESLAAQR